MHNRTLSKALKKKSNRRSLLQALGFACLAAAGLSTARAQSVYTWTGGTGTWENSAQWDPTVTPDGTSADVRIDGGKTGTASVVDMNNSHTAGRVTVDAGDKLNINDGATLTMATGAFAGSGTVQGNGTVNINGGYYGSVLTFTGAANLSGNLTINLNSGSSFLDTNNTVLTVGAGVTIAGQGQVGYGQTQFINNSTIIANQSGGTLVLTPNSNGLLNNGLLAASNGGVLQLNGSKFFNGTIQAQNGSAVNLTNGATFSGGLLTTVGSGTVNNVATATLASVANSGAFVAANGTTTYLTGTLTNNGTFDVTGGYYGTSVVLNSPVTLTGTGTLNLNNNSNVYLYANTPGDKLTVDTGAKITGQGQLGYGTTTFQNNGLINANVSGATLVLQPGGGTATFTNGAGGIAQASGGGILQLNGGSGGTFTGGTFQALAGSVVGLANGALVSAATLTTAGNGEVDTLNSATLANVTNNGSFYTTNSATTYLTGTLTNNGNFTVLGGYYGTSVALNGAVTLAGTGTVNLANNGSNLSVYGVTSGDRLTISAGATIQGAGNLGIGQTTFTNRGLVDANTSGYTLDVRPGGGTADFTNLGAGVAQASGGGILQLNGGSGNTFTGGKFQALNGSAVYLTNNPTLSSTTLVTAGTGEVDNLNTATLANVTNSGVFNTNNGSNTLLTGTLTNNGSFNVLGGYYGTTAQLTGPVTLAGTGTFNLANGGANLSVYAQNPGDKLTINAGQTVQGAGNLGSGQTTFLNNGLVNANSSGNTLNIRPGGGTATYANGATGLTEATGGGILQLDGGSSGVFTGGTFQALNGSQVLLSGNPNVSGATLTTAGSGTVNNVNNATLTNVVNNGTLVANNGTSTTLAGTLINNSTFTVTGGYYGTGVTINGPVALAGTGTVDFSNGGANASLAAQTLGDRLTIGANQTLTGGGNIGNSGTTFTNNGLVNANFPGATLSLAPGGGTGDFTNAGAGLAEASNGGNLQLSGAGGNALFTGGTFQALAGSTVSIVSSARVTSTTLTTAGSGVVNVYGATLTNVTNNGTTVVPNAYSATLAGTLTNNGTFTVQGGYYGTSLAFSGPVTLAGTGTLTLGGGGSNLIAYAPNPGDLLTINAGATVDGAGQLGYGSLRFQNNGTINANSSGNTLLIQPGVQPGSGLSPTFINGATGLVEATGGGTGTLTNASNGTFTNNGTFAAVSGSTGGSSTLNVSPGALTNYAGGTLTGGTYKALATDPGATSTLALGTGTITTNAANVVLSGANSVFNEIGGINNNQGSFAVANGRNFTTASALVNSGTVVAAGGSTLSVSGAFIQSATGTLTGNGTFAATGGFTLSGNINPGGTINPATGAFADAAGTTNLNGDAAFDVNTKFHFELGSITGTNDHLNVSGGLLALNGQINVTALPGFGAGTYDLIDHAALPLVLSSGLTLGTLPAGYTYSLLYLPTQVDLVVVGVVVPEPGTWAFVLGGGALLVGAQRLKRRRGV